MIEKLLLLLVVVFLSDDTLAEEELELREATKQWVIRAEVLGLHLRSLGSRSCRSWLFAIHGLSELLTQLQTEPHLQACGHRYHLRYEQHRAEPRRRCISS